MGLYEFESKRNNLNKNHIYYSFFLGDSYTYEKTNDDNTAYITDEAMELIEDIFININNKYDHWGDTKYNNDEIELLKIEFIKRLNCLENDYEITIIENDRFDKRWNDMLKNIYNKNKNEIKKLFKDIIKWFHKIEDKTMIVIGI